MPNSQPDKLLFFSLEHWDDVWRRNQFICDGLMSRHPNLEILWFGPSTDLWRAKGLNSVTQKLGCTYKPNPQLARLTAVRPYKPLPNSIGKWINEACLKQQVTAALKQLGWQTFLTWVNDQSARNILPLPGSSSTIYDITDDWTKASLPPRILDRIKQDDEWLLKNANQVIACSNSLYDAKKHLSANLSLVRNGVNTSLYSPTNVATKVTPTDIEFDGLPVACYLGTLHEDRLDVALLETLFQSLPQVQFAFVGPNALSAHSTEKLTAFKNCHILGSRPYSELPAYIKGCTIFINPHLVSDFTESLDPLKLYEYMATGKPIVSTNCAGFRDMVPLVKIARNNVDFSQLVKEAIEGDTASSERVNWAEQHTWQSRLEQIEQIIGF